MQNEFDSTVPVGIPDPHCDKHLNRQIPPEAHTPMYNFHKYWSRKTWNVVGKFVERYCPKGGVVFDPFGGSGVTATEALKAGRRAIISDISPLASELTRLTIKPVSLSKLLDAYENVKKLVSKKINSLYLTQCEKCGEEFPFDCAIWQDVKCVSIRYKSCPSCGYSKADSEGISEYDIKMLKKIERHRIKEWYPRNPLYHHSGKPFMKKERFETIDGMFTKRNLYALAILMEAIEKEPNRDMKAFLKITFSSMVHLCSRMTPVRPSRPMSSAWTEHSYWYANEFMESNVWLKFESAFIGKQGILRAKEESNKYFEKIRFASNLRQFIKEESDVLVYSGSCLDLMKEMKKHCEKPIVDYIFTDPPYDSSIQYGELSYLWVSWLKMDEGYIEKIALDEIVHNERQNKDFEVYHSLLRHSFEGMFDVLKHDSYLTVTFHNPTFKVRNATIRAGVLSGFELEKIHHQELARPSAKSLLQPFGSAQGDFYLRFHKPSEGAIGSSPDEIDEIRFERIVVDTAVSIIAERGEPTPYTIIINAIDPELAKRGFFSSLHTGLDVKTALEKHVGGEFELVKTKMGGATGKLWWFKNPNLVPHLEKIPLSERVEKTVLSKLQQKGKTTFTETWEAVSIAFPNSLTSDQTSIKDALETYATPLKDGFWLIRPAFRAENAEREHTTVIAMLAEIGIASGFKIWIGRNEQSHELSSPLIKRTGPLRQYVDVKDILSIGRIHDHATVSDMDILWIKDDTIQMAFEVECTTSMTSALLRGSNIEGGIKKAMFFPAEREKQFERKMKSPMFEERFKSDNWSYIVTDGLYEAWQKHGSSLDLPSLMDKASPPSRKYRESEGGETLSLFEWKNEYSAGGEDSSDEDIPHEDSDGE